MGREAAVLFIAIKADSKAGRTELKSFGGFVISETRGLGQAVNRLLDGQTRDRKSALGEQMKAEKGFFAGLAALRNKDAQEARRHQESMRSLVAGGGGVSKGNTRSLFSAGAVGGAVVSVAGGLISGAASALSGLGDKVVDFDANMRNVNSTLKLSEAEFRKLEKQVLDLAKDPAIRQGPADLSDALYDITGSGFKGAEALAVLKASAMGASAGLTDTKTSASALVSVLNSGIRGAGSPQEAMDTLFKTVDIGKGSFEELARALPPVIATASKMGVSLQEVTAFLAAASLQGQSFGDASNDLLNVITKVVRPADGAKKTFKALGIEYGASALQASGLSGKLDEITRKTNGNADALAMLFPDMQAFRGVLSGTAKDGKSFADALGQISHASDGAGATVAALNEQNKSLKASFEGLKKDLEVLANERGPAFVGFLQDAVREGRDFLGILDGVAARLSDLGGEDGLIGNVLKGLKFLMGKLKEEFKAAKETLVLGNKDAAFARSPEGKLIQSQDDVRILNEALKQKDRTNLPEDVFRAMERNGVNTLQVFPGDRTQQLLDAKSAAMIAGIREGQNVQAGRETETFDFGAILAGAIPHFGGSSGHPRPAGLPDPDGDRRRKAAETARKRAEAEARKTNEDIAGGAAGRAAMESDAAHKLYSDTLTYFTPERLGIGPLTQKLLTSTVEAASEASAALLEKETAAARSEFDKAVAHDPKHTEKAQADRDAKLQKAQEAFTARAIEIREKQQTGQEAILKDVDTRKETEKKQTVASSQSLLDFLNLERLGLESRQTELETQIQSEEDARRTFAERASIARQLLLVELDQMRAEMEHGLKMGNGREAILRYQESLAALRGKQVAIVAQEARELKERSEASAARVVGGLTDTARIALFKASQGQKGKLEDAFDQYGVARQKAAQGPGGEATIAESIRGELRDLAEANNMTGSKLDRGGSLNQLRSLRGQAVNLGDAGLVTQIDQMIAELQRQLNPVVASMVDAIGEGGKKAGRDFIDGLVEGNLKGSLSDLFRDAKQTLNSTITDALTKSLVQDPIDRAMKSTILNMDVLLKGIKASAGEILAGGYGLLAALGQQGKKKQTGSILGGLVGLGIGALLPGVSLVQGLTYGAAAGAMFTPRAGGGPMLPGRSYYMEGNRPEIVTMGTNGTGYTTGNAREVAGGGINLHVIHQGDVYDGDYRHFKKDITDDLRDAVAMGRTR